MSKIPPDRFLAETWPWLVGMLLVVVVARPPVALARYLITNQAITAPFSSLIRWQAHWHVVRQSWSFFQNDFAGRISNRVMQTGPAVRQTLVTSVTAVWYVLVYGITAVVMTASADAWLTLPILGWFSGYIALLWYFVPRMRDRSKINSEARSALMGRIVDSYTNILTVKLFARPRDEDNYVRDAVDRHVDVFLAAQRLLTMFGTLLKLLDALLIAGAGAMALLLWQKGYVEVGAIAMVLPLTLQLTNMSRQIAVQITDLFEESRHRAGRHDDDRAPAAAHRSTRRRSRSSSATAISLSRPCASAMAARSACSTTSRSPCGRARRSAWSAAPAPANRPWSICCCASSISKPAAS